MAAKLQTFLRHNTIALIALFLAMGGTAYAITLPAGSVGTAQLKNGAVTSAKVKNGSLTLADIKSSALSKMGRIGIGYGSQTFTSGTKGIIASVKLTVPARGFVLVNGYCDVLTDGQVGINVWDQKAAKHSPWINGVGSATGEWTASNTGVFPVTAGTRTFSVNLDYNGASSASCWGTVTAQFIPYGSTGSRTALGAMRRGELTPQRY